MQNLHLSRHRWPLAAVLAVLLLALAFSNPATAPTPIVAQGPTDTIALAEILTLGEGRFTAMALSADDRRLAIGLATGDVHVYPLASTDATPDPAQRIVIAAHDSPIVSLAFNGPTTLATSAAGDNAVKVWNLQNRALQVGLAGPAGSTVAYSPDGRWLALGVANESKVDVLNAVSFQRQYVVETLETTDADGILALAFSPDGQRLAFSTRNAGVFLVNVNNRTVAGNYVGPAPLTTLAFTPQTGAQLIGSVGAPAESFVQLDGFDLNEISGPVLGNTSADPDGLYDLEGYALTFSNDGAFRVGTANRSSVAPFGQALLTTFALLQPESPTANFVTVGENPGLDVAITSDSRFVYGLTADALYRFSTAPTEIVNGAVQPVPVLQGTGIFNGVQFSPDGARLLAADYSVYGASVVEYSLPGGQVLQTVPIPGLAEVDLVRYATTLAQTNDLILRGHDQNNHDAQIISSTAGGVRVEGVSAVSPTGVVITAQQTSITLRDRDPATQQFNQRSVATQFLVESLLVSADGNRFAALDAQQRLATFDLANAAQITDTFISTNVIDADGFALNLSGTQVLGWGRNTQLQPIVALINVQNGASIRTITGPVLQAAAADPTGTLFAVLTADGEVQLLDANTLETRATLPTDPAYTRLTWSADGARLAVHGGPGILRVLQVTR